MKLITRTLAISDLEQIARNRGVELYNAYSRVRRDLRVEINFSLRPRHGSDTYRKHNAEGRRSWAVCWHGHYVVMADIFAHDPHAELRSVAATYKGVREFRELASATGDANIGSMMRPLPFRQACRCDNAAEVDAAARQAEIADSLGAGKALAT